MPWEIYLDWLQDQGNDDLRHIDPNCLIIGCLLYDLNNHLYQGVMEGDGHKEYCEFYLTGNGPSSIYSHMFGDGMGLGTGQCNLPRLEIDVIHGPERCSGVGIVEATWFGTGRGS